MVKELKQKMYYGCFIIVNRKEEKTHERIQSIQFRLDLQRFSV